MKDKIEIISCDGDNVFIKVSGCGYISDNGSWLISKQEQNYLIQKALRKEKIKRILNEYENDEA